MFKSATIILLISTILILGSGCMTTNNVFDASGITFEYPLDWEEKIPVDYEICAVGPSNSSTTYVAVYRTPLPSGYTLKQFHDLSKSSIMEIENQTFQEISSNMSNIAGTIAYTDTYLVTFDNTKVKETMFMFERNGLVYGIKCAALEGDFDKEQKNFNLIINSFQVR